MTECPKCKIVHTYVDDDGMYCVPPRNQLVFGEYEIDPTYRGALYMRFPFYTAEEIIGTYLGKNPRFLSQEEWLASESECSEGNECSERSECSEGNECSERSECSEGNECSEEEE